MEIRGRNVFSVWKKSLTKLLESEDIVPTERNGDTIELKNLVLVITNPNESLDKVAKFDLDRGVDYSCQNRISYWTAVEKRIKEFNSGENSKIDQFSDITKKLSNNPYNRQAYATIWSPRLDVDAPYPICIVGAHFCIRDNRLNMTAIIRSNDAWGQALDDMYHLIQIQKEVANQLSIPVGIYTHIAMSYHIYLTDLIKAKLFLGK